MNIEFEIEKAKIVKAFLMEWGMCESDAKCLALRIVFKIDECLDFSKAKAPVSPDYTKIVRVLEEILEPIRRDSYDSVQAPSK